MMKKIIRNSLLIVLVAGSMAVGCGFRAQWELDDGTLSIASEAGMAAWVRYRATQAGEAACDTVRTVIIGDGVAAIPPEAFAACCNLESVTMADSVAEIGERAFYRDAALAFVTWPAGLRRIGESAFQETGLEEVVLPEAVEEIGLWAFDGMARLRRVVLPDSLTSVDYAFSRCPALQSVSLGGGLSRLGDYEFSDCTGLKELYLPENVVALGEHLLLESGVERLVVGGSLQSVDRLVITRTNYPSLQQLVFLQGPPPVEADGNGGFCWAMDEAEAEEIAVFYLESQAPLWAGWSACPAVCIESLDDLPPLS